MNVATLAVGAVVGAHGIGHVLGWMPAWGIARFEGVSSSSWLLGRFGDVAERTVAGALFLAPTVGFVTAVAAMAGGHPWFRGIAVASAAVSLAASAVFPRALPVGSTVGSVAVDLAVLVALVVARWEPAALAP